MKERPILFSAPMVRALLDDSKTQTRRIVKPQPIYVIKQNGICSSTPDWKNIIKSPYGQPGDHLWVRENFSPVMPQDPAYNNGEPMEIDYAATYKQGDRLATPKWKPSIHMPRWASRINLEITSVCVERLNDINELDSMAEGIRWSEKLDGYYVEDGTHFHGASAIRSYQSLWESINGASSWDANPWVWVIEFKRVVA